MSREIELTFPELEVTAHAELCEDDAPLASDLLWRLLETPFVGSAVHAIYAGPALLIHVPPRHDEPRGGQIPVENETNEPRPGDIMLLPPASEDDAQEAVAEGVTVAIFYGERGRPFTPAGWQPGVVVARVSRRQDDLRAVCRRVRFEGLQEVRLARSGAEAKPGAALLHADGASLGNPGPAGAGFVIEGNDGRLLAEGSVPLGRATNNVAEYQGLILGAREAARLGVHNLRVLLDSELICHQLSGHYRVKSPGLKPLYQEARRALRAFSEFSVQHVPRKENARADRLAGQAARKSKERMEKNAD